MLSHKDTIFLSCHKHLRIYFTVCIVALLNSRQVSPRQTASSWIFIKAPWNTYIYQLLPAVIMTGCSPQNKSTDSLRNKYFSTLVLEFPKLSGFPLGGYISAAILWQTHLHVQPTYSHVDLLWISPWAMLGKDKICKSESKSPCKTFVQGIKWHYTICPPLLLHRACGHNGCTM